MTSTYDMGDRCTEVNHPASGITSCTYDALGNVLTKQTANLAKEGKFITYDYDYLRLTGINYPDHPENNVKYYYGGRNASQNRIGRLMLREDGTGAIEYFYGKMGEVTKTRRTMIVPNQAIATYVTQRTYDSHNRLLEMIYPDEEKITYSYNLGGQLEKVHGYKSYGYDYVSKIGYDKFEQRTYLKYCNGAETFYTYDPQAEYSKLHRSLSYRLIKEESYIYVSQQMQIEETGNGFINEEKVEDTVWIEALEMNADIYRSPQDNSLNCTIVYKNNVVFLMSNMELDQLEEIISRIYFK